MANNLASLGIGRAAVLGVIGGDGYAYELTQSLNKRGVSTDLLVRSQQVPTFTYTKLINGQPKRRICPASISSTRSRCRSDVEKEVLGYLGEFAATFDVIFVSDQADTKRGGVVTASVRALLEKIAEANPEQDHLGGLAGSRGALPQDDSEAQ